LPILAANVIANAYYIIDMIFVGRLGPAALAGVSLGGVLMSFTWTLLVGLAIGTSSLIARFYGARQGETVSRVAVQSLVIAICISIVLAIFGIIGVKPALLLMGATESALEYGIIYSRIVFCGAVSLIILFIVNSIFRGSGDAKTPMITLGLSSLLNIILDPLLIFGLGPFPELGVKGAAISTVIGQAVGAALNIIILIRGYTRIHIVNWSLKPDLKLLKTQIGISIPGSLQNLFQSISGFIIMNLVASYGTQAVAAFGICMRLDLMVMLPGWAIGSAVATILGQNLGAGQPGRAEKTGWRGTHIYFMALLVFSGVLWFGAEQVISVFNNDSIVVDTGIGYLRIIVFGYLFLSLSLILTSSMNGAGYTFVPMIIIAFSILGIRIPAAYILPGLLDAGITGLWYAIAGSIVIQAFLSAILYAKGGWKEKKVT